MIEPSAAESPVAMVRPLTLIVEDNVDIATMLAYTLEAAGHEVATACDGAEALHQAAALRPDLVLLDGVLPRMSGADVCRCLRADFRTASAGIIFVTGRDSMADIEAAFDAGADDYIIKPVHQRELLARAQALLRRGKELRGLSPVTGLPGNFVILTEISRLIDGRASFALIYADLDNFKSYNDRYGFLQGDHAILVTANCLRTALDGVETEPRFLGHVGGDDFVLLVGSDDAESVANAVTTGFDASAPLLYADEDLKRGQLETIGRSGTRMNTPLMTISMGISSTSRREFRAPHDAVAVATELKALAKESRGSCWRVDRRQTG